MKLVDNWATTLWRSWSIRLAGLACIPGVAWPLVPQSVRDNLPPQMVTIFAVIASLSIAFSRIVMQNNLTPPDQPSSSE